MKRTQTFLKIAGLMSLVIVVLAAIALHYVRNIDKNEDVVAIDAASRTVATKNSPTEFDSAVVIEKTRLLTGLIQNGKLQESRQKFEEHIADIRRKGADPNLLLNALLPYGDSIRLLGDKDKNADLYRKADEVYKEAEVVYEKMKPPAPHTLGEIYLRQGIIKTALQDYQNDFVLYQRALAAHESARDENKSGIASCYVWLGNSFFNQQKWARSISNYRQATLLQPKLSLEERKMYPSIHIHIAIAKIQQGHFEQAINELKSAEYLAMHVLPVGDPTFAQIREIRKQAATAMQHKDQSQKDAQ